MKQDPKGRVACETLVTTGSVSYTHLDVYKRQPLAITSRDGKNYAYRYLRKISSEYVIEGLR